MIYWDNVITYYDKHTEEFDKPVNISLYVGKAESPDDIVAKWASNVGKLKKIYTDTTKRYHFHHLLYGNFLWSNRPKTIQLKYRTLKEGYSRDGWYIFTASTSLSEGGHDYGEFFLSDDGVLMPAERTTTLLSCP